MLAETINFARVTEGGMALSTTPIKGLTLSDPFMVASCHWTATEAAFRQLASVQPSAITLKTTSAKGGDGKESKGKGRDKNDIKTAQGHWVAKYTDGPKELELWDLTTTYAMSKIARDLLPNTKLGLSLLQGEDYERAKQVLAMENYSYVELNWKYTFRSLDPKSNQIDIQNVEEDLDKFLKAFAAWPKLIKLPRESIPFLKTEGFSSCLKKLHHADAGLLVANSRRIRVPPSRVIGDSPKELTEGVVVGDYLFLETFDTIRQIAATDFYRENKFDIVATGGIMDIASALDVFAAGAQAVQLCTILDIRGVQVIELLREQLRKLINGTENFTKFLSEVRKSDSNWFTSVTKAKQIEVQDIDSITQAISAEETLRPFLSQAINSELPAFSSQTKERQVRPTVEPQFKFILNYANIGAFHLGMHCLDTHKMRRIEIQGLNEFAARLKDKSFTYDFMILPQSALKSFETHLSKDLKGKMPIQIGKVGLSHWEIVGDKRHSGPLSKVYHFGGNSARHALEEFLADNKPVTEQIAPAKLLPSLRFWHREYGILAKPPLSRMYGLLAEDGVRNNWGCHWSWSEPLVFAASQAHLEQHGESMASILFDCMMDARKSFQGEIAIGDLFSNGFVNHCLKLVLPQRKAG